MNKKLTKWEQKCREEDLADMLFHEQFEIAEALGIQPEAIWTDEEENRILAEFDRRHDTTSSPAPRRPWPQTSPAPARQLASQRQ
jgi:hypothetical protein